MRPGVFRFARLARRSDRIVGAWNKARGPRCARQLSEALWKLRKTLFAIISSLWDLLFASLVAGA